MLHVSKLAFAYKLYELDQSSHRTSTSERCSPNAVLHPRNEAGAAAKPDHEHDGMAEPFEVQVVEDDGSSHAAEADQDGDERSPEHEEVCFDHAAAGPAWIVIGSDCRDEMCLQMHRVSAESS